MQIRSASIEDKPAVLQLAAEFGTSFEFVEEKFNENYDKLLDDDAVELIVADLGGQAVGYCLAFHHLTFLANGLVTWVEELMVDEQSRGEGVGSMLMEHVETLAKQRGSKLVALASRRAGDFYTKIGYEDSATYFKKHL